uniref:hypothetical protein n=1 Tax=Caballeronia sp. INML3 TaxID=2921752 RepID=UPI0020329002
MLDILCSFTEHRCQIEEELERKRRSLKTLGPLATSRRRVERHPHPVCANERFLFSYVELLRAKRRSASSAVALTTAGRESVDVGGACEDVTSQNSLSLFCNGEA